MRKFVQLALVSLLLVGLIAAIGSVFHEHSFSSLLEGEGENEPAPSGVQISMENNSFRLGENMPVDGNPPHVPLFEVSGPTGTWLIRSSVGETYENGAWHLADNAEAVSYGGESFSQDVAEYTSYQTEEAGIDPVMEMGGFIPVFPHATRVENLESLSYYPEQGIFRTDTSFKHPYQVNYRVYSYSEELLGSAELDLSPEYLQLPPAVTDRTRELAQKITENAGTPYEKAKTIENYLKRNYTYDKHYERPPSGWDPVDWFLFEENRGHCMNFNSAFVVLARSVDIPSRMVFGFAIDSNAENQLVYADDSHANAEVRFKGIGWVPFNATAPHPAGISDSDGDGMPDSWEEKHGLDPNDASDANNDPDGDGYSNIQEYRAGTDPKNSDSKPTTPVNDSDGDGMPDSWENQHGLDPTNPEDAFTDKDNDGSPNLVEYLEGTNPNDGTSFPEDKDGDSIPDEWEEEHGLDPNNPDDALSDPDDDGYMNLLEYLNETDPNDPENHPEDMDSDGMPDSWEEAHGLNPMDATDASADPDDDGFTNIQEYQARTDPKNSDSKPTTPVNDSDGDGMPDSWEEKHNLNPNDASDANKDPDGDGYSNIQEYQAGTDPKNPDSKPEGAKTPTTIKITQASDTVAKGDIIRVRGKVTDENQNGLGGLDVKIYLKENKEAGGKSYARGTTGDNGFFDIDCGIGSEIGVGDYYLVAFTPGNSEYENDWSDPPVRIVSGTTLSLSAPSMLDLDKTLEITGKLSENTGGAIADREVDISIGGGEVATVRTDNGGEFSASHDFSDAENYTVRAKFDGTTYYMESSADTTVEVAQTSLQILTENTLVRGENAEFSGEVEFGGDPLAGEEVNVQIGGNQVETTTDTEGSFESTYDLPSTLEIGSTQLVYSIPSLEVSELHEAVIKGGTNLEVSAPSSAKLGETIQVEAVLKDDRGDPLSNRTVSLLFSGVTDQELEESTSSSGRATFSIQIPKDSRGGKAQLEVSYGGSDHYANSSESLPVNIRGVGGGFPWLLLLAIIIPAAVGFYLWKRGLLTKAWSKAKRGKEKIAEKAKRKPKAAEEGAEIQISFPQIGEDLPNVWGVGEELQASCELSGVEAGGLQGRLELVVDGENIFSKELEDERECTLAHTFGEKGVKRLRASFSGGSRSIEGSAEIRIVDYREEIIKQYNDFIEKLKRRGISIGDEMTPMELRHKTLEEVGDGKEAIRDLVGNFERAEYSLHEVGRKEFVNTMRARMELEGKLEQQKPE